MIRIIRTIRGYLFMEYVEHKAVWWPCAVCIAGLRIRPMTLGQLRLLDAVNSPFIAGGVADADDCAIALYLLSTPWRKARKSLGAPALLAWRLRLIAWRRVGDVSTTARELEAFVSRVLWVPERYETAGAAASSFAPASGLAVRMAVRAARIGIGALGHGRRGAWGCVWDIPVDAVLAYGSAAAETEGQEYQTRSETESLSKEQLQADTDARHDQSGIDQHPQNVQHVIHSPKIVADPVGDVNEGSHV